MQERILIMLSKQKFLEYMNELKELENLVDDLNAILDKLCFDKDYIGLDRHDTLIIKLIEESMNDKDRMISTYIYETDWGNIPTTMEHGEDFSKINSLDSLYDYIEKRYSR